MYTTFLSSLLLVLSATTTLSLACGTFPCGKQSWKMQWDDYRDSILKPGYFTGTIVEIAHPENDNYTFAFDMSHSGQNKITGEINAVMEAGANGFVNFQTTNMSNGDACLMSGIRILNVTSGHMVCKAGITQGFTAKLELF